ncbi:hypothetical protein ACAX43_08455 [Paraburkholderia sp. IW21]|uniref:hypothetical protein n=1 Tax=Paraburkholderia sp. IW21 TaxID=3242488 RepID=UPI0035215352
MNIVKVATIVTPSSSGRLYRAVLPDDCITCINGRDPAMNTHEKCLRSLIEKWFSPTPAITVRVIRAGCTRSNCRRCVRVEALGSRGLLAIFFFQHDDGSWQVFPPEAQRPAIGAYQCAA